MQTENPESQFPSPFVSTGSPPGNSSGAIARAWSLIGDESRRALFRPA
jgi:hypothetical protein